ncbi:MAG: Gfo/Idh/MocA family oxidoreductase [Clostridia bacterium]|nr:Gfo/Idh/MocA family oxidoreductase [Clostridia bacterium]
MKPIKVVILGCGSRGNGFAKRMAELPEKYQVVAVADPKEICLKKMRDILGIGPEACYTDWRQILSQPKVADLAIIATMDKDHYEPAMEAIALGYHLLLEKPVAPTPEECADIAHAAQEAGVTVLVCHVLRYAPFYRKVKELLLADTIGTPMSLVMVEGVGHIHYSSSYVRGQWHSEAESSPMLLAKSCHDLDIIQWLMDRPCKQVQSFGSLTHFTPEQAPEGAPVRCADGGCPVGETCPYNCMKIYYEDRTERNFYRRGITKGISTKRIPDDEEVLPVLQNTDYGLCVYHANNDVTDHQVVNLEFEGGATASFSVNAFNEGGRYIRIFGTKGELYANASDTEIRIFTFEGKKHTAVSVLKTDESIVGGHGGGDDGILRDLYESLAGTYTGHSIATIDTSVKNHFIGFAAERARRRNTVVSIDEYMQELGFENRYK